MRYMLTVGLENDVFVKDDKCVEVARILRQEADKIMAQGLAARPLKDINGNLVGQVILLK